MRTLFRSAYCVIFILILAMSAVSCSRVSDVVDRIKDLGKPKTQKPAEKKPTKTQPKETQPKETQPKETQPKETQPKETQPEEPDVQSILQKGLAHRESGDLKEAIASFERALEIEPKNAEAAQYLQETQNELDALIDFHLKQGIKYFTQENLQDAMREWDKVLELDPSNQEAFDYKERTQKQLDALKGE